MAKNGPFQRSGGGGAGSGGRPSLEPANPLSVRVAILQIVALLGIPIALLLFAKVILRTYFPELGY
jgi:hypothetical protein